MIEVKTPDGKTFRFPDGTPQETMKAAIKKQLAPPAAMPAAQPVQGIPLPPQPQKPPREMMMERAKPVYDQLSGNRDQRPLEFPDAGEITDINIPMTEGFLPTLKSGLTPNETGKANVLAKHFASDERFGGAYQDKNGNPFIRWEGQPYYINKPGLSGTDVNDFLAALTMFAPASKLAGAPATIMGRGAVGLPSYAATDAGMQLAGQAAGSKERLDLSRVGTSAGIGAMIEAFLPPALQAGKRIMTASDGAASTLPGYGYGKIPFTKGQATGDLSQMQAEEAMRQGARGPSAQTIMRGFDDSQRSAINTGADTIESQMGAGTGIDASTKTRIGARLQDDTIAARDASKAAASAAYTSARESGRASLSIDGFRGFLRDAKRKLSDQGFDLGAPGMENVRRVLEQADTFSGMKGMTQVTADGVETLRRRIVKAQQNNGSPSDAALGQVKRQLDQWLDNSITDGLMMGDQGAIDAIKNARSLWSEHMMIYGGEKGAGNKLVQLLDTKQSTPVQFINYLVSVNKVGNQGMTRNLIQRMNKIFGKDSEQIDLLKSAYITEAFTKNVSGEAAITPTSVRNNINYLINGDGAVIARELFSMEEMAALRAFADDVAKTITPADALNPSKSSWAFLRESLERGLLPAASGKGTAGAAKLLKILPFTQPIGAAMDDRMASMAAQEAVNGFKQRLNIPLVAPGTIAGYLEPSKAAPMLATDPNQRPAAYPAQPKPFPAQPATAPIQ